MKYLSLYPVLCSRLAIVAGCDGRPTGTAGLSLAQGSAPLSLASSFSFELAAEVQAVDVNIEGAPAKLVPGVSGTQTLSEQVDLANDSSAKAFKKLVTVKETGGTSSAFTYQWGPPGCAPAADLLRERIYLAIDLSTRRAYAFRRDCEDATGAVATAHYHRVFSQAQPSPPLAP